MTLIILPSAESDIKDAVDWYSKKAPSQVERLVNSFTLIFNRIQNTPYLYQVRYKNVRIAFLGIFPYGVHYIIDDDQISVIAVLHTKRLFK